MLDSETVRPALFSSVESMSDWIVKTTGIISQVYPFQCGGDDVTRSQRKDVCGSAINPFNPNLFDEVDESTAEASWHEMMEDVKLSHADFKTTVAPPSDKPKELVVKFYVISLVE